MFVLRSYPAESDPITRPGDGSIPIKAIEHCPEALEPRGRGLRRRSPRRTADAARDGSAGRTEPSAKATGQPRGATVHMPLFAAAFAVRFGGATAALECPKHFADVQALIDRVGAGVDRAQKRLDGERMELVRALLDDARTMLLAARENYERPRGSYDHARAFAKADTALGHARAAEIVYSRLTQE